MNLAKIKKEGGTTVNMRLAIDQMCEEVRREGRREMLKEVRKADAGRKEAEAESRELRRKYNVLKAELDALNRKLKSA